ncbi:MAG TPA: hypothetical protein DCQ83_00895, partial [Fibrobacteres bacterium]|nr:hypothetical protein [Fibrobacterota bacterium]
LLKKESRKDCWTEAERRRLFEAHLRSDEASIHTLHGFCHSILKAHALENETLFDSEVADERTLLHETLDGLLRGPWARDTERLREFLGVMQEGKGIPKDWRSHLVSVALAYQPGRGDRLAPDPDPNQVHHLQMELEPYAQELRNTYARINRQHAKDTFLKVCDWLEQSATVEALADRFLRLNKNSTAYKKGFVAGLKAQAKDPHWVTFAECCQHFHDTVQRLQEARRVRAFHFVAEAVRALRERLVQEKKRLGALSYDDMVSRLTEAVRNRPSLVEQLRERYRVCIVDEFQDTDPLQWELLRRLCLDGKNGPRLFLVGDPKQAIYGFRGGDLRTYFAAREELHMRATNNQAQGSGLRENWRSSPSLIDALNATFSHPSWFGLAEIAEESANWKLPGTSNHIPFTFAESPSSRSKEKQTETPVVLRDFTGFSRKSEAQKIVHTWIAAEIRSLMQASSSLVEGLGGIAILTRTNPEAAALEKSLRRAGIPCRIRRRGGVFDSIQADQIRLLLELLETARDPRSQTQILTLPFLRREWPRGIPEEIPDTIRRWAALAQAGRWTEFFQSLLYEHGYIHRLAAQTRGGSEVQTLLALARRLTEEGMKCAGSPHALLHRFDSLRLQESGEESETSNGDGIPRVTIMTLHLSKGLEFPVIFLASLSESRKATFYTLRDEQGFQHILDRENETAEKIHRQQASEEDRRLFYVGLTRAKQRLYVPLLPEKFSHAGSGPLGGFASDALREAARKHEHLFRIDRGDLPHFSPTAISGLLPYSPAVEFPERDPWEEAGAFFQERTRKLSSYSQIVKRAATPVLEEDGRRLNREESGPEIIPADAAEVVESVTAKDLPPGPETGNALHELLEAVDFQGVNTVGNADLWMEQPRVTETARSILARHGLTEDYLRASLQLVWNTLHMPLVDPKGGTMFRLSGIAERKHEMEFLLPWNGLAKTTLPEHIQRRDGFLWGFMDLVFRHQDRYFLLDWKSNLLERYTEKDIAADMDKHDYHLQYQLYSVALDKWLKTRVSGYDPDKHFGGIYYLYLRGASPQKFSGYFHQPTRQALREAYPARLREILGMEAL